MNPVRIKHLAEKWRDGVEGEKDADKELAVCEVIRHAYMEALDAAVDTFKNLKTYDHFPTLIRGMTHELKEMNLWK